MTLLQNYRRQPVTFVRGQGAWLEDESGKTYVDLVAGIAVNALGHADPRIVEAIARQSQQLVHCSNLYFNPVQSALAARLCALAEMSAAFFCNSGTEAVEAAIKLSRKFWHRAGRPDRNTVVYATGGFHGRTFGALAATDNAKYREGFGELPRGFERVGFNDMLAVDSIGDGVAAVIVEPVQGEAGVREADATWLEALRARCTSTGALLIFDEIQCGLGRSGALFAYLRSSAKPDALVLAKSLGGGLPLGALLVSSPIRNALQPGDHGSTFGGNPVACAAALAFLDALVGDRLSNRARTMGERLTVRLRAIAEKHERIIGSVRCVGLMAAVDVRETHRAEDVVAAALAQGVLVTSAAGNAVRFLPPLTIGAATLDEGLNRFESALFSI